MERERGPATVPAFLARLRGGPDDGDLVRVSALPSGAPPDFFHAGPADPGMYVLAGLPHEDGSLPYWFIPSLPGPTDPVAAERSTWTLISLAGGVDSPRVWHQHGDGASPVPLRAEPLSSSRGASFIGRAYTCPVCGEATVIDLPQG